MKKIENIAYANEHERQVLDLYLPDKESFKTFVYFHGGGIESGNKDMYAFLGEYLANCGYAAVIISYRVYPTAKYPEFIEDAALSVKWTFDHINEYGNCEGIYAGGSSAGGYMSMMLCFDNKWLGACGINPLQIAGFFHDAGQPTAHFNVLREKGIDTKRCIIDETAPLFYVGLEEKYAPMHFVISDNDIACRPEQTSLVLATLKHFGHTENITTQLMHGTHCAYDSRIDEDGKPALGKLICDFLG